MASKPKAKTKELDNRPVVFSASVGILTVIDSREVATPDGNKEVKLGLRLKFTADGDDNNQVIGGGYSRKFSVDQDNHDQYTD